MSNLSATQAKNRKRCTTTSSASSDCGPGTRLFFVEDLTPLYIEAPSRSVDCELMFVLLDALNERYTAAFGGDFLREYHAYCQRAR